MPRKILIALLVPLVAGVCAILAGAESGDARFQYNRHGQRNPFVPLIIPTATPTLPPTATATPTPLVRVGQTFGQPTPTPTQFIPPPFVLEAILIRPEFMLAVIDGELVKEGDVFGDDGILLRKIERNRIVLELGGQKWERNASTDWRFTDNEGRPGDKMPRSGKVSNR